MKRPKFLPILLKGTREIGEAVQVSVVLHCVLMEVFEFIVSAVDGVVLAESRYFNLVADVSLLLTWSLPRIHAQNRL